MSKVRGGIEDLSEFLAVNINQDQIDTSKPLESQGIIDSLTAMHYIIFLEKKYNTRLSKEDISSISVYSDLLSLFAERE